MHGSTTLLAALAASALLAPGIREGPAERVAVAAGTHRTSNMATPLAGGATGSAHANDDPPVVAISPGDQQVTGPDLEVTITWCGLNGSGYDPDTRSIKLDGVDVSSYFTTQHDPELWKHPECEIREISTGTIPITKSSQKLVASIATYASYWGTDDAIYTRPEPWRALRLASATSRVEATPGQARSLAFAVTNTGESAELIQFTRSCSGGITCGAISAASATVQPGETHTLTLTVPVTASATVGSAGQVAVTAAFQGEPGLGRTATTEVATVAAVTPPPPLGAPSIELATPSATTAHERALCVAVAAGDRAASECGDLRVVHELPAVTTFGTSRAPTLIYNSGTARPTPIVRASVRVPGGTVLPDSVTAVVQVNGVVRASGAWPGSQWGSTGTVRSIALMVDASGLGTSVREYVLTVTARWTGGATTSNTATGLLQLVDRSDSPYGAGWWIAGLERVIGVTLDGKFYLYWIGGDGSTRLYEQQANWRHFVASKLTRPDSITWDASGQVLTRHAPNGVRVFLDYHSSGAPGSGMHDSTMNRLG